MDDCIEENPAKRARWAVEHGLGSEDGGLALGDLEHAIQDGDLEDLVTDKRVQNMLNGSSEEQPGSSKTSFDEKDLIGLSHDLASCESDSEMATNVGDVIQPYNFEKLSRTCPRWSFVSLTSAHNKTKWYVRQWPEYQYDPKISYISIRPTGNLLSVPYCKVKEEADMYLQKIQEKKDRVKFDERVKALLESCGNSTGPQKSQDGNRNDDESNLLVERYKPKMYLQLLSNEDVNRTLLSWLKLWDKVVFKKETPLSKKKRKPTKNTKPVYTPKVIDIGELDEHGCPQKKLALLVGPPGLGKTTLVHLIAEHAGYHVVEMNASDDRSPDIFSRQLDAATNMNSVLAADRRPNCLVLDEIDGASVASVEILVKYATGKMKGKKKPEAGFLKRPIICICNDLYASSLKPLRQVAVVITVPPIRPARLAQRLMSVCKMEDIRTSMNAMMTLAEKTNCDIRSSLSVLEFLKDKKDVIKVSDIQNSCIGQKDVQKGVFSVWQEIFEMPRPSRDVETSQVLPFPDKKAGNLPMETRISNILQTVQQYGDYNLLCQGVFENFLNIKFKDSSMEQVSTGLDWFCHTDVLMEKMNSTQNYSLYPYIPFSFAAWHVLYASNQRCKLSYPTASYEATRNSVQNKQTLEELVKGMTPAIQSRVRKETLVLDMLPLMLEIIKPNLRAVNLHLYSSREKAEMRHLINVMVEYNLTYVQERTPEGDYTYRLEPNIEDLCLFPDTKRHDLSYQLKQLIAQEVELEKMKRLELRSSGKITELTDSDMKEQATMSVQTEVPKQNHLQKIKPKAVTSETKTVDFFGRLVEIPLPQAQTDEGYKQPVVDGSVWFHYKEGINNAVRRSVKMRDLE